MDKEQRLRAARVLAEFLRNEDLRAVFDAFIDEATDALANTPATAVTQLQDAAYQLRARRDFLLILKRFLGDASMHEANEKELLKKGEPN